MKKRDLWLAYFFYGPEGCWHGNCFLVFTDKRMKSLQAKTKEIAEGILKEITEENTEDHTMQQRRKRLQPINKKQFKEENQNG